MYPARYLGSRRELSITNNFDAAKLPVLIVGAGPVGLVLSILLTKLGGTLLHCKNYFLDRIGFSSLSFFLSFLLGVKCALVDKATRFSKHPQAHFINNRSMEVAFSFLFFLFLVVMILYFSSYAFRSFVNLMD